MRYINFDIKSNLVWSCSTYWIFLAMLATPCCSDNDKIYFYIDEKQLIKELNQNDYGGWSPVKQPTQIDIKLPNEVTECTNAKCIIIDECPYARELVQQKKHKQIIRCGWENESSKVCCPIQSVTTTVPLSDIRPTPPAENDEGIGGFSVKIERLSYKDRTVCGKEAVNFLDRIYGGTVLKPEEFPWIVRLQYEIFKMRNYFCGGSLITRQHVLTAAHCLDGINIVSARFGEWNVNTDPDCVEIEKGEMRCVKSPIDREIRNKIIHPQYDKESFRNDIGMVTLNESVTFNDLIRPICLPTTIYIQRQAYSGDMKFETAGWGLTETGSLSVIKRKVTLNAAPTKFCISNNKDSPLNEDQIICAGGQKNKDSCEGDSGGPLAAKLSEDDVTNYFLFGITSYGPRECGAEGTPGVYTRVSYYMEWIEMTVNTTWI